MDKQTVVLQGKGISKSDKELVNAILGGEMKNAWQKGDGVDQRGTEGPYARKGTWAKGSDLYRDNYNKTFGKKDMFFNLKKED